MVDQPDLGPDRRGPAIEVGWPKERRHRACRRRGAVARGTVGDKLRVALVQPDDGVAQVVRREVLGLPASSLGVDLVQGNCLYLVGADVERPTGKTARRRRY